MNIYQEFENPLFMVQEIMRELGYNRPKAGAFLSSHIIKRVSEENKVKYLNKKNVPTWFVNKKGLIEILLNCRKNTAQEIKQQIVTLFFE